MRITAFGYTQTAPQLLKLILNRLASIRDYITSTTFANVLSSLKQSLENVEVGSLDCKGYPWRGGRAYAFAPCLTPSGDVM